MEKIFVLIALTFVGIFQQVDAKALVTYTNFEEFRVIFLKFAGDDKALDFGELMLMIGRRIMKYDDLNVSDTLEDEDGAIYGTLMEKTVREIFKAFFEMAGDELELTISEVEIHFHGPFFKTLFSGTWNELQVASPPKTKP